MDIVSELRAALMKLGMDPPDDGPARDLHPGTQRTLDGEYKDEDEDPRPGTPFMHGGMARARHVTIDGPSHDGRARPIKDGVDDGPTSNAPAWFHMLNG